MALIRKIIKTTNEHYPFSVPVIDNLKELDLNKILLSLAVKMEAENQLCWK